MTTRVVLRSAAHEAQSLSLEERARLQAKYFRALARDAREGAPHPIAPGQLDTAADLLDALASRAEAAA